MNRFASKRLAAPFLFLMLLAGTALGGASEAAGVSAVAVISGLVAGLAIFLFGIDLLAENMRKAAGNRMRSFLQAVTRNRFYGLFGGALVTILMQSSSATTVLVVSFTQAHLMTAAQSVGVIIGSNVGTTVTTQLIAFKLTDYSLWIIALGYLIRSVSKRRNVRWAGYGIVGVGFIFFGMALMSEAMKPLRQLPWFTELVVSFENPIIGILAGALITGVIQSSAAFMGIVIALAQQGLVNLNAGIPLIFGANIGTCVTAFLASLQTSREAKRVALVHVLFNVGGVLLLYWFIPQLARLVEAIPVEGTTPAQMMPRQLANAHTLFNIIAAVVFLPFTRIIAALAGMMIPVTAQEFSEIVKPKYLDWKLMDTPALAIERVRLEMIYVGEIVEGMIRDTIEGFVHNDPDMIRKVIQTDDNVDRLIGEANRYLTTVLQKPLNERQAAEGRMLFDIIGDMEHVGDLLETMTSRIVMKKIEEKIRFSDQGMEELRELLEGVRQAYNSTLHFIGEPDQRVLPELRNSRAMLEESADKSRRIHFERLAAGVAESVVSHQLHVDMLDQLLILDHYIESMIGHAEDFLSQYKAMQSVTPMV